jgi:very-short-patch-repair endonuclease
MTEHLHLPGGLPLAAAILVLMVVGAAAAFLRGRAPRISGIQPKPLMTENEKSFYLRLQRALPGHIVFPQVSFAAFLTHDSRLSPKARFAVRGKFNRKIADFIVCDRETLQIAALIELDDRTHVASADRQRDELTAAAGYKTIRFQSKQKPTEAEIAALFPQFQPAHRPNQSSRAARSPVQTPVI